MSKSMETLVAWRRTAKVEVDASAKVQLLPEHPHWEIISCTQSLLNYYIYTIYVPKSRFRMRGSLNLRTYWCMANPWPVIGQY